MRDREHVPAAAGETYATAQTYPESAKRSGAKPAPRAISIDTRVTTHQRQGIVQIERVAVPRSNATRRESQPVGSNGYEGAETPNLASRNRPARDTSVGHFLARTGEDFRAIVKSTRRTALAVSSSFAAIALVPGVAAAQSPEPALDAAAAAQSPEPALDSDSSGGLDEIVVTAQRREQSIQDVPISVLALSATVLEAANINSSIDLANFIPGLEISASNGAATTFLRGVGTDNAVSGTESPVAYYVDGVYLASPSAALFTLNNVERVEVLKGPQGTLFGRNASGGVIQIITRDPKPEFGGEVRLGFGNYDTLNGSLYVTTGVLDQLATDLAVSVRDQGKGYGNNATLGTDVFATDNWAIRNQWLYSGDDTRIRLSLSATETKTDVGTVVAPLKGSILLAGETNRGSLTSFSGIEDPGATIQTWDAAVRVNHDFDTLKLVSITSFQNVDTKFIASADNSAAALLRIDTKQANETFTQEFQLLGDTARTDWIIGVYYFYNDAGYDKFNTLLSTPSGLLSVSNIAASQRTNSYAAYGQVTQKLTDRLRGTIGLRYTRDERDFAGRNVVPTPNGPVVLTVSPDNNSTSDGAITWRLAVDYDLMESVLGYVSYNRGFKSGQFAINTFNTPPVDSEILDAFEVGLKSNLFQNRLRLNAAAFYYDYKSLQSQTVIGTTPVTVNAGDAVIMGLDIDFEARLADRFRVFGGFSLLDTESKDYPNPPNFVPNNPSAPPPNGITLPFGPGGSLVQVGAPGSGNSPGSLTNARGNSLPQAAEFSATLGASYTVETASAGGFEFNANLAYNDGFFFEFENRTAQKSYAVLGASINWTSRSEKFRVSLWGANITDERYYLSGTSFSFGDFGFPAQPATYGVSLRAAF